MNIRYGVMKCMAAVWRGLVGCGHATVCVPPPSPPERPRLEAPPAGHPERLVPYALLPSAQQRVWRELDESLR
jgi:hypothetical protein